MEAEVKAEFERSGFSLAEEEQVLQKCLTFCINFGLTPSDLVSHWEVFYLNRQLSGLMVESAHLDGFLSYLQNEQKESIIKGDPNLHVYSSNEVDMLLNDEEHDVKESFLSTPINQVDQPYLESNNTVTTPGTSERPSKGRTVSSNRMTPFGQRTNKFVLQFAFNHEHVENGKEEVSLAQEDDLIKRIKPSERCSLQIHCSQPKSGCRFMYDKIEDKFVSLENRIRRHATAFAASGFYGELTDATLASQKSIFAVGMIYSDGEGRLNENSVLLQGSVEHSEGQRVRLDLQKLDEFSLFPGQVIGVEGQNPSGHCLIASKLIDSLPLSNHSSVPSAKRQALDQEDQPRLPPYTSKVLSMVVAAGPFTTTDNLLFEPLNDILAYASRKQPQLLILMGPFVDSEHPDIKKGTTSKSFDDIFNVEINRRLQDYIGYMGSAVRVILVPSIRDAHHDFVYPQPAYEIYPPEEIKHQITCIANPSIFSSNEVTIGCSTVDVLKQLSAEEISRIPPGTSSADRMARLANNLLRQRSFYPLYPPSIDVPLDLSLAPEALEISLFPDILLIPSDLTPFVKVLELQERNVSNEPTTKCMCVNPGRLAKGIGGGTFVELAYDTNPDRTTASILRI